MKKSKIVKLGVVGVDSGHLIICDPCYIDSEYKKPIREESSNHRILKHKEDGTLWQYCYRNLSGMTIQPYPGVFPFPGSYMDVIPKYNKSPNELIESGDFIESDIDPMGNIPDGEFSYDGICKSTQKNENHGGQLKYSKGHEGVAVSFTTGFGDGLYDVFAEIVDTGDGGERVKKVWVEFF